MSINSDDISNKSDRYKVEINDNYKFSINQDNDEEINEEDNIQIFNEKSNNKLKLPFMIYILIFTLFLLLGTLLTLMIVHIKFKENYCIEENIYLKPSISEHNYTKLKFNNGLEIILTQIHHNDIAGGALSFNTGYLDTKYDPGLLKLTFLSLRHSEKESLSEFNKYMGELNQASEEFYSSIYFTVSNAGFKDYLKNFKNIIYFDENENFNDFINRMIPKYFNDISFLLNNVDEREKHLIEFLVYNITDENGNDIWRQGIGEEIKNKLSSSLDDLIKIKNDLYIPNKIKMIFSSHYKMSLTKKYILKYFSNLIKLETKENNQDNKEYYHNLITNKIIFHQLEKNQNNNYIKINYYIKNNEANLNKIHMDSGYFNYIKYILEETHEDSLYYKLTHPEKEDGLNIKSLSCNFEVVLNKYIKFSIVIKLNEHSYNYIKEILEIIYNYMEKIKTLVENIKLKDIRAEELYNITEQNFSFAEDVHEGEYYKNKAKDLFYKDEHDYFLKEVWFPPDYKENFTKINNYIKQLKMENSVVIIGINKYTIEIYNLNNTDSFIFHDIKKTSIYSNISYSIHNLEDLNIKINIDKDFILSNHSNEFISKNGNDSLISKGPKKSYGNYTLLRSGNDSDNLVNLYYLNDTSFGLPKVYLNLYFFHPFIRPNYTQQTNESDKLFFNLMIYLSYLKREINLALSDAIRAGNIFKLDFTENYFYIDIFAYSDQIEKIVEIIKKLIISNKQDIINEKNFAIYRDYALYDLMNFDKANINEKLKYKYFKFLSDRRNEFPPIYNYYDFDKNNFLNITLNEMKSLEFLNSPLIRGMLLGYIEESQPQKIYDLLCQNFPDNFNPTLMEANYDINKINDMNFVKYCLNMPNREETKTVNNVKEILDNNTYSFMYFGEYTFENRVLIEMLSKIALDLNIYLQSSSQQRIYLRFSFSKNDYKNTSELIKTLKEKIIKDKANYKKDLDVIGDKYYYLMKNMERKYSKTPDTLKKTAIEYSYSLLYEINEEYSFIIDEKNYDDFGAFIKDKILVENKNYYELSNM